MVNSMLFLFRALLLASMLVLLGTVGLVWLLFLIRSKDNVYRLAKLFALAGRFMGIRVQRLIQPAAQQVKQAVYIANHQNNFDLFTLAAVVPRGVVTVGKKSILWIPFFGQLYWASGNFLINRNNRDQAIATITQVVEQMKRTGLSIWMFPEGTRSRGRGMLPFKAGAFHAAIQAGLPIVPVVCSNTHDRIRLNRWDNGRVYVEMMDPIPTDGLSNSDIPELMERCHQLMKARIDQLNQMVASAS